MRREVEINGKSRRMIDESGKEGEWKRKGRLHVGKIK